MHADVYQSEPLLLLLSKHMNTLDSHQEFTPIASHPLKKHHLDPNKGVLPGLSANINVAERLKDP
jgi:hypothetical protein